MSERPILTAAEMRAAEAAVIAGGVSVSELMERAGAAVAEAVWRYAGPLPTLVLCGPGNNGGDGYVVARLLAERGVPVRVAATGAAKPGAAAEARAGWTGPVDALAGAKPAAVLVDALFGTGLARPLSAEAGEALDRLAAGARIRIAVDLPSGVDTDSGALFGRVPCFDLTVALGALKPAHRLQPAAEHCGRVAVADIGVPAESKLVELGAPALMPPGPADHKYSRGMVAVVAGAMPGAAELAARAALGAGAGYVLLLGGEAGAPRAIVRRAWGAEALRDKRIGAVVIGPGLGRDCGDRIEAALASGRPLVIDGDALRLIDPARLPDGAILTPHAGEFDTMFGAGEGSKVERTRAAAARSGAVVVFKGADTVIAAPDGRAVFALPGSPWLSTAGTGDVLAGAVAAMHARRLDAFTAAKAGVWLHARAAERLGAGFIADDLASAL